MAILNMAPIETAVGQGTYPRRGGRKLTGTCIVHTTEGNWMGGVDSLTNLIRVRADYGAYHRGVDWEDIAIYFDWEWESWQDSETNPWAVGISAACRTSDWGKPEFIANGVEEGYYRNLARCAADFVVYMQDVHNITVPLRRITGAQARAGVPGFCAHGDSGVARSDPGANFNWVRFFNYISEELTVSDEPSVEEIVALTLQELKEIWSHVGNSADRKANFDWLAQLVTEREFPVHGADGKPKLQNGKPKVLSIRSFLTWYDAGIDTIFGKLLETHKLASEIKTAQTATNEKLDQLLKVLAEKK